MGGVDLETHGPEEHQLALIPKRRPKWKPLPVEACLEDLDRRLMLQLENRETESVTKRSLLENVSALKDDEDEMADMWRRIRRTRHKMDSQTQVLNGFLNDVAQIKRSQVGLDSRTSPGVLEDQAREQRLPLPCSRQAPASKRPLSLAAGTREQPMRSASEITTLAKSRSTPSLAFEKLDSAPVALPARRAPPQTGAPSSGSNARRLAQGKRAKSFTGL